jgi:hypothetical protein
MAAEAYHARYSLDMRAGGALLFLCGCNQVFGLEGTVAIPTTDAPYFDAPVPKIPVNSDPFLTSHCGRLYFSAIGYIFWVQRT